jgi:hypothetical protein
VRDRRDTPDTQEVTWEYPGFLLHYTCLLHNSYGHNGDAGHKPFGSYGIQFHGTRGTLFVDRAGYQITPQMKSHTEPGGISSRAAYDDLTGISMYYDLEGVAGRGTTSVQHVPHVQNFLKCVKSRELPVADIEIGHRTTTACHLGNIALRMEQKLHWDGQQSVHRQRRRERTPTACWCALSRTVEIGRHAIMTDPSPGKRSLAQA